MLEPIISINQSICLVFGILLRTIPLKGILSKKQKNTLVILYVLLLIGNSLFLTWMFYKRGTSTAFIKYNCLIVGMISTIFNSIVVPKRWKEHIFISGITMLCEYVILGVPGFLIPRIIPLDDIYTHTAFVMMYVLILAFVYGPLRTMLDKTVAPFLQIDKNKYWNILWFIPTILCIALYMMFPYEETIQTITQLISRVLMGIVMIIICFSVVGERKRLLETQMLSEQMNNSKMYYSSLQVKIEESRKIKHNLKHLLVGIRQYIETEDKEGLKSFCDNIEQEELIDNSIPYTGNVALDGLLYHYLCKANASNIDFKYVGKLNIIGIKDMDLCILLGNALDNAFTGCLTISDNRRVTLITQVEKETVSFVIKNQL